MFDTLLFGPAGHMLIFLKAFVCLSGRMINVYVRRFGVDLCRINTTRGAFMWNQIEGSRRGGDRARCLDAPLNFHAAR